MSNTSQTSGDHADVVIVGGGSAGAVLAARLSEDATRTVLLLEAGEDFPASQVPADLADAAHVPGEPEHDWGYVSRGNTQTLEIPTPRGKAIGGSSSVNATAAVRARKDDFDKWAKYGVTGWSFAEVVETFKALENTPDGEDAYHGRDGRVPIRQRSYDELSTSLKAFIDASVELGYKRVTDFNGADQDGVDGYPVNVVDGVRQSTALTHLGDEVRARPNLTVRGDILVDRVLFDGVTAIGVIAADGAVIGAGEVILSAGSYGSPAILLRSGVGPAADLNELGIEVLVDLPVGQHLQDQPFFYNAYALKEGALDMEPVMGALLWIASSEAEGDELDLHITATHLMDGSLSPTGGAIVLATSVVQPDSFGTLTLRSRDPLDPPQIDNNFLAEDRDRRRLLEGVKVSRRLGRTGPLAETVELELLPGDAVQGDDALAEFIDTNLAVYGHPTSTVPMGGDGDPWAVVNSDGAVTGVRGLRVIDASIMPVTPSTATNLTTIMVAERLAERVYGA